MKKDAIKARNRAANLFYDLADTSGISRAVRDRLRSIGDEISNYRLNVISDVAADELCWLGENIRDFIEPENLRILDNFAAEVKNALTKQDVKQEGGKIMGLLDKLRGKGQNREKDDEETQKAKKNIFLARQLIEKNMTLIEEENKKIADILDQAAGEAKDSPRYTILQGEWQLCKDRIRTCSTKMTLAFNTLKVNSKMIDAVDIFETTKLLERMMPDSKKAEKLLDKAMDKTEDLVDMQDDLTALLEDALDEMNGAVAAPVSDKAFGSAVSQQTVAVRSAAPAAAAAPEVPAEPAADAVPAEKIDTADVTDEQIDQFLTGA